MKTVFEPSSVPSTEFQGFGWWFVLKNGKLLVCRNTEPLPVPFVSRPDELGLEAGARVQFLGSLDGSPCYSVEAGDLFSIPDGMTFVGLRRLFAEYGEDFFRIAGIASQLVTWDRTHRFCGACGALNEQSSFERAKICPSCGLLQFPRISPAVIVAIVKEDRILLARGARFRKTGMFSVLAGYVECGETLEECIEREVAEEVGIEVCNIEYFASQQWPFPHSLMIGFTAEYRSGEIKEDRVEILEAGWFSADNLPEIPEKVSIARRLIDWFVESRISKNS
ncbi:MAG TPA: NAD(+) diphosphatase [Desulfobacteraceae bacterium]|jgi:NAD+ diphosphatase|nr:NAD(+) diphosphatase [Desulfobacteraceae bacterium]